MRRYLFLIKHTLMKYSGFRRHNNLIIAEHDNLTVVEQNNPKKVESG